MEIKYLFTGIVIGVSIAAPVGPIGFLCVKRSLNHGFRAGLVTGLGAATADAFYGFAAGCSLTFITEYLLRMTTWLHVMGGLVLCFLGLQTLRKEASDSQKFDPPFSGYVCSYVSTLFFTLTNPMTIMAFMGIFTGLGIGASDSGYAAWVILVTGVFGGSALWWTLLASASATAGTHLDRGCTEKINIVTGTFLILFGIWTIGRVVI